MPAQEKNSSPQGIEFYGGYQVYSESGVDLTLLRENLRRSVEERLAYNRSALALVEAIQAARQTKENKLTKEPEGALLDASALLHLLHTHKVEFVVIGGLAMIAHGSAHITRDLDVCYRRSPENLAALAAALSEAAPYLRGAPPGLPFRLDVPTVQAGLNFTLVTTHGDLDLLGEVSGVGSFDQVLAESVELTMFGLSVRFLSLDGLIAAKKAAGRGKDRQHLLELEELKKLRDATP
jgi:hypothetical protein